MSAFDIQIEEFVQGSWIADLKAQESFLGAFTLPDGSAWVGTTVTEHEQSGVYHTRVIGGAGKLGAPVLDKFYSGSVSLSIAVADVCGEAGEKPGMVTPGLMLTSYQRLKGTAAQALSALAEAFDLIWWIDRTGLVNMQPARPVGPDANGSRVASDVDSLTLLEPSGLVLGVGYNTISIDGSAMPLIQHIRWHMTSKRFEAQLYAVPFTFRTSLISGYLSKHSARVDRDNGDGTIDVIVDGRYGEQRVPFYSGLPGAKVTLHGGDAVTVGYLAGDPQQPYAESSVQLASATKQVARTSDAVKVTIPAGSFLISCSGSPAVGVPNPSPIDITGTIQAGSSRVSLGD